jgi:hypothetical protein
LEKSVSNFKIIEKKDIRGGKKRCRGKENFSSISIFSNLAQNFVFFYLIIFSNWMFDLIILVANNVKV